jgi:hypothetical protein
MFVTFHSKAWSSIIMNRDIAVTLLKMMGHSGTVPSAIRAAGVEAALMHLNPGLAAAEPADGQNKAPQRNVDKDEAEPVSLKLRAFPLVQMLTAAAARQCDVTWEEGAPLV